MLIRGLSSTDRGKAYRVALLARRTFQLRLSNLRMKPALDQRAALSVQFSQLQLGYSTSISSPQASSLRSELSTKRAAENVIAFCRADRNLSSKSFANYFKARNANLTLLDDRRKKKKKKTVRSTSGGRSRPPSSIGHRSPQPRSLHVFFQICRVWFL